MVRGVTVFYILSLFYFSNGGYPLSKPIIAFKCCLLQSGMKESNIVFRNNSKEYNFLNYQWLIRFPSKIYPLAYVLVETEEDIISSVNCGRKYNIQLVPKSGGHSYEKYSFGNDNSAIIDLRKMDTVIYDKSKMSASVGSGALIFPVLYKLYKNYNVSIPAPIVCPNVGVGGVASGGGYGLLSGVEGTTLDQILEMNIVIANGTLLTVNKASNTDLFFALRGAGAAQYGIISKFIFKVRQVLPKVLYGVLHYDSINMFPKIFNTWQHFFVENTPKEDLSSAFFYIDGKSVQLRLVLSSGKLSHFVPIVKKFPKPSKVTTEFWNYPELLVGSNNNFCNAPLKSESDLEKITRESEEVVYRKRKSFNVKENLLVNSETINILYSLLERKPKTVEFGLDWTGGAVNTMKNHETAFIHRDTSYVFTMTNTIREPVFGFGSEVPGNLWMEEVCQLGYTLFNSTETYQNYVDADLPDYLSRYYGSNLPRLIQIKQKYDPKNYFRNPQSIPPVI